MSRRCEISGPAYRLSKQPGEFAPYTYVCTETKAPAGQYATLPDFTVPV